MNNFLSIPIFKELKVKLLKIKEDTLDYTLLDIPKDTSIIELQKLIYYETDIPIINQYIYSLSPLDEKFYNIIDTFFNIKPFISPEKIKLFLSKILTDKDIKKLVFTKKKIDKEFIIEFLSTKKITTYYKTLNINFQNGVEFIDLKKISMLSDTFVESNHNLNLAQFQIIDETLFLYSKLDIKDNLDSVYKTEILNKYFWGKDYTKSGAIKSNAIKSNAIKSNIIKSNANILKIYKNEENSKSFVEEYKKPIGDFITDKITEISLLYTNFIDTECDIQKIFNSISMSSDIVFGKISIRRKKQYYKIFKHKYFGDDATISKKMFNSWRFIELTSKEKEFFDNNSYLDFKILFTNNEYISILITASNFIIFIRCLKRPHRCCSNCNYTPTNFFSLKYLFF